MSTERIGHHGPSNFASEALDSLISRPSWFTTEISSIPSSGRALLQEDSRIPAEEVLAHVQRLHDCAFAIWPYACIGSGSIS